MPLPTRRLVASVLTLLLAACASSPPPPADPPPPPDPAPPPPVVASSHPAPSLDAPYTDEAEVDPRTLTPSFPKAKHPPFPKAKASEATCWQQIALSGEAQKDYDALVERCGTPTGAVAYAPSASGKLHSVKDKRDTFLLHLYGGLCYRFFGVADGSIKTLDVLILQKNGALVGDAKAQGPVAILEPDRAWCMDKDVDYQFAVEVTGEGTGRYLFGAWARAK